MFWLALLPAACGQGVGGTLLQSVLDHADKTQVGCYLVSSNPRNISFYERHGFQQRVPLLITDGPRLMGMWRDPQTSTIHE